MSERIERSFRGISERLATRYLENLGGERRDDGVMEGTDWTAALSSSSVEIGPTLTISEVTVVFEGDGETLDEVVPAFARKAMRAGG